MKILLLIWALAVIGLWADWYFDRYRRLWKKIRHHRDRASELRCIESPWGWQQHRMAYHEAEEAKLWKELSK